MLRIQLILDGMRHTFGHDCPGDPPTHPHRNLHILMPFPFAPVGHDNKPSVAPPNLARILKNEESGVCLGFLKDLRRNLDLRGAIRRGQKYGASGGPGVDPRRSRQNPMHKTFCARSVAGEGSPTGHASISGKINCRKGGFGPCFVKKP